MTAGHLLFAAAMSSYILVAIRLEERDLVRSLGQSYENYRQRVPMLVPGLPKAETVVAQSTRA
jgi:protein-S-isoprenylcysteine O-methyltransferase Ste14